MKGPRAILFVQALALFALLSPGYPLFKSWCRARLAGWPASPFVVETAALALLALLVALLDRTPSPVPHDPGAAPGGRVALERALRTLAVLGLVALALRLVDPLYDGREFRLRGLTSAGALWAFLPALPFGVAAEEIVFRACQRRLRAVLAPAPGIAAVALCFAVYHWAPGTPLDRQMAETLVVTCAGGLVLAYAYEWIGSVPWLIAIHLAYDLLAVAQTALHVQRARVAELVLFAAWIVLAEGISMWLRRPGAAKGAPDGAKDLHPAPAGVRAATPVQWFAALGYGLLFPLLLAWIRIRLT